MLTGQESAYICLKALYTIRALVLNVFVLPPRRKPLYHLLPVPIFLEPLILFTGSQRFFGL
jgi:hypothetical protein